MTAHMKLFLVPAIVLIFNGCTLWGGVAFEKKMSGRISHPKLKELKLESERREEGHEHLKFSGGNDESLFIEVSKRERPQALKSMGDRQLILESMYADHPSAYPGVITSTVKCPTELKPKTFSAETGSLHAKAFELFASERFSYGSCAPDQIKLRSYYALVYCDRNSEFFEIKFFLKKESAELGEDFLRGFACGSNT